jgi:hypothetical protein
MIIYSKAGMSLLLFLIYFLTKYLFVYTWSRRMVILIPGIIIMVIVYQRINTFMFNSRAFLLLQKLLENPGVLLKDGSILTRYAVMLIGYYGLITSRGLGNGLGAFSFNWNQSPLLLSKKLAYSNELASKSYHEAVIMPGSVLGGIAHDFGIPGLIIFLYIIFSPLFRTINTIDRKYVYLIVSNIFLLWFQICSYALPIPWFLLGIAHGLAYKKITLYEQ